MENIAWYIYILISLAGVLAGFINTIAGSGSLITLPLLMFAGLPANVANGTNRIAILLQNIIGVSQFKKQKILDTKAGLYLTIPTTIGALVGAFIAIDIDERIMKLSIGGLLIIMFFLILFQPDKWVKGKAGSIKAKPNIIQIIIFFFIGLYGGFIQAGVGFFLLSGLVLGVGYDLLKANALKLLIILAYTPLALVVFIYHQQVNYELGFTLAIGNMLGAYIASKTANRLGNNFIRYILLGILLISATKLLGLF
jgi:uncharacterized membrane protein YfcA